MGDAPVDEEMLAEALECEAIEAVGADRAYDSNTIHEMIARAGKQAVIPPRSNRRNPPGYDKAKDKERNKIECLFGRLKQFRAIATLYDKLAAMFLSGVIAGLLVISLKS